MEERMIEELDPRAAGAKRLQGKICIVTGAGQGIGRATAKRFAAEGATVVIAERIEETARRTHDELTQAGAPCLMTLHDVSEFSGAHALMQETHDRFGRIDVIANVVGGTIWWQPFHLYTEEQIHLELERSLYTTLWCCHEVLPFMIAQKSGSIVNVSSRITAGGLYRVPYGVSKGGVDALTVTLAAEYGRYGIRVNAVATGRTTIPDRITPRETLRPGKVAPPVPNQDVYYQETRDHRARPLDRTASPAEQASTIAFLASEDASYMTGQIVACSGGI